MIKARAGELVIIGLSRKNIEKLQEGLPIYFDGKEVHLDGCKFLITFGETEHAIIEDLNKSMAPPKH
jgi:hypothetical protein